MEESKISGENSKRGTNFFLALCGIFLFSTFYFLGIQLIVEELIRMAIDFVGDNFVLVIPVIFLAIGWLAMIFVFYYFVRTIEEAFKSHPRLVIFHPLFYILPSICYFLIRKNNPVDFSLTVVIVSFFVYQVMERVRVSRWFKKVLMKYDEWLRKSYANNKRE